MLFYANSLIVIEFCHDSIKKINFPLFSLLQKLIIRFFFVSLQPKAASTGYASAIQVNLIALGLHRPCPREQKDYDYDADISMKVEIVLGDEFKRQFKRLAKKYPSLMDDFITFKKELADDPFQGSDLGNLSPSPARGMFHFGDMVSGVSFQ